MKKLQFWMKNHKWSILGAFIGGLGGWLYWKTIGCKSGTCMITSKPFNSTLYFAVMGYFVVGMLYKPKKS